MTSMKVKVFNTTGNVYATSSGLVGPYTAASVDGSDAVVAKAIRQGDFVVQGQTQAPVTPAVVVEETPNDPEPEAEPRRRSRNRTTEPEA